MLGNKVLILSKREWQTEREAKVFGFNWTDDEIDNAKEGLIGTKFGIDCYVTKHIPAISN